MTDTRNPLHVACNQVDEALFRISGLSRALPDLSLNSTCLGKSDPDTQSIVSLVVVIGGKAGP